MESGRDYGKGDYDSGNYVRRRKKFIDGGTVQNNEKGRISDSAF